MKKCPKCGRTSPPALAVCPRCKTPFTVQAEEKSGSHYPAGSLPKEESPGPSGARTIVTASILAVLVIVLAVVLYMNRTRLSGGISPHPQDRAATSQPQVVRPANFNELLGTWSGREINRNSGWTFSFSDGYNVYASGPEGWYRGKASIHWDIGGERDGMRVPPGAGIFDVDIEDSSAGNYRGKVSVGAFSVSAGSTLKLCSGEPGQAKRPLTFDPEEGIRCFELTKTSGAPVPPPGQGVEKSAESAPVAMSVEDEETRAARDAYKRCAEAIRSGNMDLAKTFISGAALEDMERSGHIDMAMGMITGMNLDEFQASRQGDRITFKKSEKQGDATMSMSIKMVREEGQWKLGN